MPNSIIVKSKIKTFNKDQADFVKHLEFKNEDGTPRDPVEGEKENILLQTWSWQLVEENLNCEIGKYNDIDALKKCLEGYKYLYSSDDDAYNSSRNGLFAKMLYAKTLGVLSKIYIASWKFDEATEILDLMKRKTQDCGFGRHVENE